MAKYEKRNVKKIKAEKPKLKATTERIEMKPEKSIKLPKKAAKTAKRESKVNKSVAVKARLRRLAVVKGYKDVNRKKTLVWVAAVVLVVGLFIFASAMTPTGIGEYVSNSLAVLEKGAGYPQRLSGDDILHAETNGQVTYVLSETFLETYNATGYNLINDQHGFSNPALKTSAARALVFDRGGTGCKIYNLKRCIAEHTLTDKIIAGYIGRDGSTAFVLNSSDYASRVEIYNKDFVRQYSWNAANETISAVALSNNGSKIAVATLKSVNGEYLSFLYIFDFKSASPIYSKQISGDIIVSLYADNKSIWAVSMNGVSRIAWGDHSAADMPFLGGVDIVCHSGNRFAVATPSSTNSLNTAITVYDKKGRLLTNITVTGEADDICLGKDYIYVLISDSVFTYDLEGTFLAKTEVGYDVKYLTEPSGKNVGAVSTGNLTTFKIK